MVVLASIQMLLAQRIWHIFIIIIITTSYCPLLKYEIQKKSVIMRDQREWLLTATPDSKFGLDDGKHHHATIKSSSLRTPIIWLLLEKCKFRNWKTGETKIFDINIIAITKYVRPYFQLLAEIGLI